MRQDTPGIPQSRLGVCIEMALADRPFLDRFASAAGAGFQHVEMWFVDGSYSGTPESLAETAADAGVAITNTVVGAPDGSVGGGLTDPSRRDEWLARVRMTFEFNVRAGIPAAIVCTGNEIEGMNHDRMMRSVYDGLCRTAELAEEAGIELFLEPLNTRVDHPGYFLSGSDAAAELCRDVGSSRLKLLFDVYHMQIMEGNVLVHIERNLDVIGHVHVAGVPGRHEPERGELDYPFILSRMSELGYRGVFGLEYAPTYDHAASLEQTAGYLSGAHGDGA